MLGRILGDGMKGKEMKMILGKRVVRQDVRDTLEMIFSSIISFNIQIRTSSSNEMKTEDEVTFFGDP